MRHSSSRSSATNSTACGWYDETSVRFAAAEATVSPLTGATVRRGSLSSITAVRQNDRLALEHLLRYGLRPPLALDRLDLPDGSVRYRMKRTFSVTTRGTLS